MFGLIKLVWFLNFSLLLDKREMRGISNVQESCMRAFTFLEELTKKIATKANLSSDVTRNFNANIALFKSYLKCHFMQQIGTSEAITSHWYSTN